MTRRQRLVARGAMAIAAIGGATTTAVIVIAAPDAIESVHPDWWADPETGVIDPQRVPEYVQFSTVLTKDGVGWIRGDQLIGIDKPASGKVPIYAASDGTGLLGYYVPAAGTTENAAGTIVDGLPSPDAATD